jgi:hypothetical protein
MKKLLIILICFLSLTSFYAHSSDVKSATEAKADIEALRIKFQKELGDLSQSITNLSFAK